MRNFCLIFLLLTVFLTGCKSVISTELQSAEAGKAFSVQVPSNLVPVDDLHDLAPLQYADAQNGLYLIGLYEPKDEMEAVQLRYSLPDYAWFVERTLALGMDTAHVSTHEQLFINGFAAETVEMFGAIQSPEGACEAWMRMCILESPTHFYQLIGWTSRDLRDAFRPAMEAIECSFIEFNASEEEEGSQPGGAESSSKGG
jgi:hypothetical protein